MAILKLTLVGVLAHLVFSAPSFSPTDDTYSYPANGICTDYTVEEKVTWNKAIWGLPKPKNNFDIAALRISAGALDGSAEFHPFSGYENLTSTYQLAGTFCTPSKKAGKEKTVLLASHGGGYDRRSVQNAFYRKRLRH